MTANTRPGRHRVMLNIDLGAEHHAMLDRIVYDSRKTKSVIIRELIERVHKGQIKVKPLEPGTPTRRPRK